MNNEHMTPEQFCYWLRGHFELGDLHVLTEKQVIKIKAHLDSVFDNKIDSIPLLEDVVSNEEIFKKIKRSIKNSGNRLKPIY